MNSLDLLTNPLGIKPKESLTFAKKPATTAKKAAVGFVNLQPHPDAIALPATKTLSLSSGKPAPTQGLSFASTGSTAVVPSVRSVPTAKSMAFPITPTIDAEQAIKKEEELAKSDEAARQSLRSNILIQDITSPIIPADKSMAFPITPAAKPFPGPRLIQPSPAEQTVKKEEELAKSDEAAREFTIKRAAQDFLTGEQQKGALWELGSRQFAMKKTDPRFQPEARKVIEEQMMAAAMMELTVENKASAAREALANMAHPNSEIENGYQAFKKLASRNAAYGEAADADQIVSRLAKNTRSTGEQAEMRLFSGTAGGGEYGQTNDDVFQYFKERLAKEKELRGTASMKAPELPKTTLETPSVKDFTKYESVAGGDVKFSGPDDMKLIRDRRSGEVIGVQNRAGETRMLTKEDKLAAMGHGFVNGEGHPTMTVPEKAEGTINLKNEAKKYKNAKEFSDSVKNSQSLRWDSTLAVEPIEGTKNSYVGYRGMGGDTRIKFDQPILGDGKYFAFSEEDAAVYGKNVEKKIIAPEKMLTIENDEQYRSLAEAAGLKYPNPKGLPSEEAGREIEKLNNYLKMQGYDSVKIEVPTSESSGKLLQKMFKAGQHDGSQIFVLDESIIHDPEQLWNKAQIESDVLKKSTIPETPAPMFETNKPVVPKGEKLRQLPESIKEGGQFPEEINAEISSTYTSMSHAEVNALAQKTIDENPSAVLQRVLSGEPLDPLGSAQARLLSRQAAKEGRMDDLLKITKVVSPKATTAGQTVEILKDWGSITPEGAVRYVQKEIDAANAGKIFGKAKELTTEKAARIVDAAKAIERTLEGTPEREKALGELFTEMSNASPASIADKIAEWGRAIKLTTFKSIERNWLGNLTDVVYSPVKRLVAGMIDATEKTLTHEARVAYVTDAAADLAGRMKGVMPGLKAFVKALKTEAPLEAQTIFEHGGKRAIKGKLGYWIRAPFRAMNDELFGKMAYHAELNVAANRAANAKGLFGEAHAAFIARFMKNPPKGILKGVEERAAASIYHEKLGAVGSKAIELVEKINIGPVPVGRIITPFMKFPTNVLKKFAREKTIFAPFADSNLRELKAGGAIAQEAKAKMILGVGMTVSTVMLAMGGHITGRGPKSATERKQLELQGWKPYSIKVGDKYYSYANLGELTLMLAMATDATEAISDYKKDKEGTLTDLLARASLGFSNAFYKQSFLTGFSDALDAIQVPNKLEKFLSNTEVGMIVPTGVANIANAIDSTVRSPKGFTETMESRIPGLRSKVPPALTSFGEEKKTEGGWMMNILTPISVSTEVKTKLLKTLDDLGKEVGSPSYVINKRKLTRTQSDELLRKSGQVIKTVLTKVTENKNFDGLPDADKEKIINQIIDRVRSVARDTMAVEVETDALDMPRVEDKEKRAVLLQVVNSTTYKTQDDATKKLILERVIERNTGD